MSWRGKPASRLAESLWLALPIAVPSADGWRLVKLGREIDPRRVVWRGGRHLHAVEGAIHRDGSHVCHLDLLDSALLAPGSPRLLHAGDDLPDPATEGLHACLWNNVWGTNFPMWYDEDASFRFDLTMRPS